MGTLTLPKKDSATPAATPAVSDNPDANIERLAPTPELNPRNQILKDINERRAAEADAEAAETLPTMNEDGSITDAPELREDSDADPDNEPAAAPEPPQPSNPADGEPAAPDAAAAPTKVASAFNPDQEYELLINGVPTKVKGSQIIETGKSALQKDLAADYKLQVASELLAQAEAARKAVATPAAPAEPELTDEQLVELIQFGTTEQAAKAIKALRGSKTDAQENMTQLAANLPKVVSDQIAFNDAQNFVTTEYGDLLADPDLRSLFFMKENAMRDAKDQRPYKELYKVIGEELRTKFNRPKVALAAATATPSKTMEQRQAAKAAAPAAPRLASARMEAAEAPKPKTPSQIIADMNKKRGQASGKDLVH